MQSIAVALIDVKEEFKNYLRKKLGSCFVKGWVDSNSFCSVVVVTIMTVP